LPNNLHTESPMHSRQTKSEISSQFSAVYWV